jgi:branched-chain amino acid aminotransferase
MEPKVYIDGTIYSKNDGKISVYDHGLLYGDGVFEGIRVYSGLIFRFKEHMDRLCESARSICLDLPVSRAEIEQATIDTVRATEFKDVYIRLLITRGVGDLGLDPNKCPRGSVIIIVDKIQLYDEKFYREGISLVTSATRRIAPGMLSSKVKSLNYLNSIMAKMEARRAGCAESLMLNQDGFVCECSGDNIFTVKNGAVYTPAPEFELLLGVTRGAVIDIARRLGLGMHEVPMTRHEVFVADECFLTGTGAELVPVISLDGRNIGDGKPGPVTARLLEEFRRLRVTDGVNVYA